MPGQSDILVGFVLQKQVGATKVSTMQKRKLKPSDPPRGRIKTPETPQVLAVGLVDSSRIRNRVRRAYEKSCQDLQIVRDQLEQFQMRDKPNYDRWVRSGLEQTMAERYELRLKYEELFNLYEEVRRMSYVMGISEAKAYYTIKQQREEPYPPEEDPFKTAGTSDQDPHSGSQQNPFEDFFDKEFRPRFGAESGGGFDGFAIGDIQAKKRPNVSGRIKEVYRALVRHLHPDIQQELTEQKREWWHQVQEAYETKDIQQLEVILTFCEIDSAGSITQTSLDLLMRVTRSLKQTLRELKAELDMGRFHPAWQFSRRRDLVKDKKRLMFHFTKELVQLRKQLAQIEAMVKVWEQYVPQPASNKPSNSKKPSGSKTKKH